MARGGRVVQSKKPVTVGYACQVLDVTETELMKLLVKNRLKWAMAADKTVAVELPDDVPRFSAELKIQRESISLGSAAAELSVAQDTIKTYLKNGKLKRAPGRRYLITSESVEKLKAVQTAQRRRRARRARHG